MNFGPQTGSNRSFGAPCVNSAFCFVARRCTRRSANRIQPNFAKRKEANGADASRIRWRRIANVNEIIEMRSLVSRGPKNILRSHSQWHRVGRPSVHGNAPVIATFSSWTFFAIYYGSGVMMRNVYSSAVFAVGSTSLHLNFTQTLSSPINRCWHQKTRDTGIPDGEDRIDLRSLVLTQYRSVTDRRTDGRICRSIHSAVKIQN